MGTAKLLSIATLVVTALSVSVTPVAAADPPHLLKDLRPGFSNPFVEHFTSVGNLAYFDADDGVHGRELYVSDGTAQGTHMVKDIFAGSGSGLRFDSGLADVNSLTASGNRLFFVAHDGVNGASVYVTNGTSAGTKRLMRRNACPSGSIDMVDVGPGVMFASKDSTGACNLYVSDGTTAGTVLVTRDVKAFQKPVLFKNQVFFLRRNQALWKTSIVPGSKAKRIRKFDRDIEQLVVSGQRLYLNPGARLWKSDGSAAGTKRVPSALPVTAYWLTDVDGTLIFQSHPAGDVGTGIWKTRGTRASTRLLEDLGPKGIIVNSGGFSSDHHAFFNTGEDNNSLALWASDGTVAGTGRVGDMYALWTASLGDHLYFGGCQQNVPNTCYDFFTSDGTNAGTYRIDGADYVVQVGVAGNTVLLNQDGELWAYNP